MSDIKFIRFTDNAERDLQQGVSYNVWEEEGFNGLCGFIFKEGQPCKENPDREMDEEDRAKQLAGWNAHRYAEHYEGEYAVYEGEKIADGVDGVIFRPTELVCTGNVYED